MECLYRGDQRALMFLCERIPPQMGENIRKSRFVYSMYLDGKYLLFHMLSKQLLVMKPQEIDYFADDRLFPSTILQEELPAKLYENHFLVQENSRESQAYLDLKAILVRTENLPRGITHYVILPTMSCNARCFYCYERGMQTGEMSDHTLRETLRFIREHRPEGNRKIHIHWFGGEPLFATDRMDRICAGLVEAGIGFDAEMTSNGSLFNEELVRKAAEVWKVGAIQITLDGMAEEYARRKCYTDGRKDPFDTVIRNIHLLIAAGISVKVRLNVDNNNLGEIFQVVDFLDKTFSGEERKKMMVYASPLFGRLGERMADCPLDTGNDVLEARVLEINDYIWQKQLQDVVLDPFFTFRTHSCMATVPECSMLIDAHGRLFACPTMTADMQIGDVRTGIDPEAWKRVTAPCAVRKECQDCIFLPQCTEFDRCPTRLAYDHCFHRQKCQTEYNMRVAYGYLQERKQRKQQEAPCVSD